MTGRLLLLSSSSVFGGGDLEYARPSLQAFLGNARRISFIPYALSDHDGYTSWARDAFQPMGYALRSLHEAPLPSEALLDSEAIFCGGGNTFRLLKFLYDLELIDVIRNRVREGVLYSGASAGAVVAGPTIMTTNDMPIVQPPSLHSLGLVPFQINPHYFEADPSSRHMGETRDQRIEEFHEENPTPVVALREGAILHVLNDHVELSGIAGARVFRRGRSPVDVNPGTSLDPHLD